MFDIVQVHEKAKILRSAFLEIQQPRSNFALDHFVKKLHDLPERQYEQIVEELRRAYGMIRGLLLDQERLQIEKANLIKKAINTQDRLDEIEAEQKDIALDDVEASLTGKLREFDCLYKLWEEMPKYTREDIEKAEPEYWRLRLTRQAGEERVSLALGVGRGNLDALWQAGMLTAPRMDMNTLPVEMRPQLEHKEEK